VIAKQLHILDEIRANLRNHHRLNDDVGPHDMDLLPDPVILPRPASDAPAAQPRKVRHRPRRKDILHARVGGPADHSTGERVHRIELAHIRDGEQDDPARVRVGARSVWWEPLSISHGRNNVVSQGGEIPSRAKLLVESLHAGALAPRLQYLFVEKADCEVTGGFRDDN